MKLFNLIPFLALISSTVANEVNETSWWSSPTPLIPYTERVRMTGKVARTLNHLHDVPDWRHMNTSEDIQQRDFCAVFRGLEWLAFTLAEDVEQMGSDNTTSVYAEPQHQKGPIVRVLRAMMMWEKILRVMEVQLWDTKEWDHDTQVNITSCYVDYVFQTRIFLDTLRNQAKYFTPDSYARCLVSLRLGDIYKKYSDVAMRLHHGLSWANNIFRAYILLDGHFPDSMPSWWNPNVQVEPGKEIRLWLQDQEGVFHDRHVNFMETKKAWNCSSSAPAFQEHELDTLSQNVREAQMIAAWDAMGGDEVLRNYVPNDIETAADYVEVMKEMGGR